MPAVWWCVGGWGGWPRTGFVPVVERVAEVAQRTAEEPAGLGQLARPEDQQNDHENDHQLRNAQTEHRHDTNAAGDGSQGVSGPEARNGGGGGLVRSSVVVAIAVGISRILGLVREQVFAGLFGAGRELDAFVTAFRIPNLFRDLFAEGALSAAFVTTFARWRAVEGDAAAWRLAARVANALALVVGLLVVAGMLFAPGVVDLIAPGFAAVPGKAALTVELTRMLAPFLLFVALAAVAMGVLNTHGQFGVPASASSFFNLGSIVVGCGAAWWFAPDFVASAWRGGGGPAPGEGAAARAIFGMAIGTLAGGALQLAIQLPAVWRSGYRHRWELRWRDPGVRAVLRLMAPATIGAAAVQINVMVSTNFASALGDGAVSWLNVAFRFMQLPIGLFGVAVGTVALPTAARQVAASDHDAFRSTITRALRLVFALCIPAAVGLAVLSRDIVGVIYEHGRFTPRDTAMAAQALVAYSFGLAGYANIKVLVPAFYALGDARTPAAVAVFSIAVNALLAWLAVHGLGLGPSALALVTSIVALVNFLVLFVILQARVGRLEGIVPALGPILAGGLATGLAAAGLRHLLPAEGFGARVILLALAVPLAAVAFVLVADILGLAEARSLRRRLAARWPGRSVGGGSGGG